MADQVYEGSFSRDNALPLLYKKKPKTIFLSVVLRPYRDGSPVGTGGIT